MMVHFERKKRGEVIVVSVKVARKKKGARDVYKIWKWLSGSLREAVTSLDDEKAGSCSSTAGRSEHLW